MPLRRLLQAWIQQCPTVTEVEKLDFFFFFFGKLLKRAQGYKDVRMDLHIKPKKPPLDKVPWKGPEDTASIKAVRNTQ